MAEQQGPSEKGLTAARAILGAMGSDVRAAVRASSTHDRLLCLQNIELARQAAVACLADLEGE